MDFGINFFEDKKDINNMSLRMLEDMVYEITKKQNYILNCGLSDEVIKLAIKELQDQKRGLLELMHKKVDELCNN